MPLLSLELKRRAAHNKSNAYRRGSAEQIAFVTEYAVAACVTAANFMRKFYLTVFLLTIALLLGCNDSSDSASSTDDEATFAAANIASGSSSHSAANRHTGSANSHPQPNPNAAFFAV